MGAALPLHWQIMMNQLAAECQTRCDALLDQPGGKALKGLFLPPPGQPAIGDGESDGAGLLPAAHRAKAMPGDRWSGEPQDRYFEVDGRLVMRQDDPSVRA